MSEQPKHSPLEDSAGDQPEQAPLPKKQWRPGCVTYFLVALLLIVFAAWGGYAIWKVSLSNQLVARIADMRTQGEPVWFADLEPEPISAEENGLAEFRMALQLWEQRKPATNDNYPATRLFFESHREYDGFASLTPGQRDEVQAMLDENQDLLQAVRAAIAKPVIRVEYDYTTPQPWWTILGEMDAAATFRDLLLAEAALARHDGELDQAAAVAHDTLRLSHGLRGEFFVVSQHLRMQIERDAIAELCRTLAAGPISEESFQSLDEVLASLEATTRGRHIVAAERASAFTTLSNTTPEFLQEAVGLNFGSSFEPDEMDEWAFFQFEALRIKEQILLLQAMDGFAELVDEVGEQANVQMEALEDQYMSDHAVGPIADKYDMLPGLPRFRAILLAHRQLLINARFALRVARHFRTQGSVPQSLTEVVDDGLPAVEPGLLSQQPLVYRVFGDGVGTNEGDLRPGFEIYDVGPNGIDDQAADGHRYEEDSRVQVRFGQSAACEEFP